MAKALGVSLFVGTLLLTAGTPATAAAATLVQQATLAGASDAFFGYSVAVDGNTAVVGALNDNSAQGAVYVYVQSGGTWALQQKLTASDGAMNDQLGYAVDVSGDTIFASAGGKEVVYVFARSGASWTQQAEISEPSGPGVMAGDCFGCSLALRGSTGFIGASGFLSATGAAYAFGGAGGSWSLQQSFVGQTSGDSYGFSVALSEDGKTAIAGAYGANQEVGQAYVLTSNGAGTWSQQAILTAGGGQAHDRFAYSVALSGGTALIGAYGVQSSQGAAYLFSRSGTAWSAGPKLVASNGAVNDFFGFSVALSGSTAVVGAFEKGGTAGAAYAFTNGGSGTWSQQTLTSPLTGPASFGYSLGVSASTVLVGAFSSGNDSGNAVVFTAQTPPQVPALPTFWSVALLSLALGAVAFQSSFSRGDRRS